MKNNVALIKKFMAVFFAFVFAISTVLPISVFSAAFIENFDDGAGVWTAGNGVTVEQTAGEIPICLVNLLPLARQM